MRKLLFIAALIAAAPALRAKVSLPQLFQSGMVLQRGKPIPLWGWADKGEQVTVLFNKRQFHATADGQGRWRVDLPKMKAGGPYIIKVCGRDSELSLSDVLIGDVWLCSGQSNIDVPIERVYPQYPGEIDGYENPQIRLFRVQNDTDTHGPKADIRPTPLNWKPLNRQNAWPFSAVGYFLGKRMFEKTRVPQGVIVNSWGGTPIEAWISADSLSVCYPLLLRRTQMMQSDDYVRAQAQANALAARQWQRLLDGCDPGLSGQWAGPGYDDSQWAAVEQDAWQWPGVGTVWLRQHVTVDRAHAGKPARLLLGTLFDHDVTYVNGRQVGHTFYQYPPRRYDLPEGLLREGDNVITIRFICKYGAAHFIPQKPYLIAFGDDRRSQNPMPDDILPLATTWKCHPGADMPPCPGGDVALQNLPTTLFNALVHPLAPFALSGVVWYQGESNTANPAPYADCLRRMMGCWRDLWHDPAMPFVIVQLANYDGRQQTPTPQPLTPQVEPVSSGWAQLREAQRRVAGADPKAELAVIIDLGETVDIHPLRKKEVAHRVALCFDRLVYNNQVPLSPQVIDARCPVPGAQSPVILTLDQPIQPGHLSGFEVAGPDGRFHCAQATALGRTITVLPPPSLRLPPRRLRYAWRDDPPHPLVRSLTGLPMSPFELTIGNDQ